MKKISTIILLLTLSTTWAQTDTIEQSLISATNEFRNSILLNSPDYEDFEALKRRWSKIEKDEDIIKDLLYNLTYGIQVYDPKFKRIQKILKKQYPNSLLHTKISEQDVETIKKNLDLLSFINDQYLEDKYPYKIKLDTANINEIKFINIQPNEVIADIGSGNGNQILLTSLIYQQNDFILSEIDFSLVIFLQEKIKRNSSLLFKYNRRIDIAIGKNKSLNLGTRVDKIIVRNSFHHFKKKEEMLESMIEYLNPNGSVIFIEPLKSNSTSVDECKLKMDAEDVIKIINQSSLKISKQEIFQNTLYISCKI